MPEDELLANGQAAIDANAPDQGVTDQGVSDQGLSDQGNTDEPLAVEVRSGLIHRIRSEEIDPPVAPNAPALNPPLGKAPSSRPTKVVAANGQELSFSYDPVHREQLTKVEDDFGRALTFEYIDCQGGTGCTSATTVKRRLSRVVLRDAQGASLQNAQFTYTADGYLATSNVQGRSGTPMKRICPARSRRTSQGS